jgi:putative ABC transport system ATP-binding protein
MVTHEPRAAAIADRVLFLADGLIVHQLEHATAQQVLDYLARLDA